jgi:hypothetical protein
MGNEEPVGFTFQSGRNILTTATRNKASLPHFAQCHRKKNRPAYGGKK